MAAWIMITLAATVFVLRHVVLANEVVLTFRNVAELNRYLETAEIPTVEGEMVQIKIVFTGMSLLNGSIDLTSLAQRLELNQAIFEVNRIRGFIVGPETSPVLRLPYKYPFENMDAMLVLGCVDFALYDRSMRPIGASCEDYVSGYYDMTPAELERADKQQLLRELRGLFAMAEPTLQLTQSIFPAAGLCPLLFKDSAIHQINVDMSVQKNFLRRELFEFSNLSQLLAWDADFDLNCSIRTLVSMGAYRVPMDNLVRPVFLSGVEIVLMRGVLLPMEDQAFFKTLKSLRDLRLFLANLREFLHSSTNEWLGNFHFHARIDPALWCSNSREMVRSYYIQSILITLSDQTKNSFAAPDEDFCLFRHLARSQALHVNMEISTTVFPSSCLYWYLAEYQICYKVLTNASVASVYNFTTIGAKVNQCDFEERLRLCSASNYTIQRHNDFTLYDFIYVISYAELFGPILTFPIISAIGFFFNFVVILALRDKTNRLKHFKGAKIYSYLELNSMFNSIECLLSALTLMNECLGPQSIYCSSIQQNYFVQLFKVVVVQYVGEAMKTCSILALLAFSIERYIHTSSNESSFAKKFTSISIRHFTVSIVAFGFATSVCKLYEYLVKSDLYSGAEIPNINIRLICTKWWFNVIYIGHYIMNDLILLILNLVVDIFLVVSIRQSLKKKLSFEAKDSNNRNQAELEKKKRDKESTERKTNKMIVYQLILYLFCRLPELLFFMHFYFLEGANSINPFYVPYIHICFSFSICYLMANVVQYFYMLSYLANVYFLYKFNRAFRNAFKEYLTRARLCCSS